MSLQNQWISLYTEVFKLQKDMTQDGSLFPENKAKLPLSVRIKCFFRIIKVKKQSNSIDKFSKKIIESLHYVKYTIAELQKGNVSFGEDEFAEFLYKDDPEQFDSYKCFRDQQVNLYREKLEKEYAILQTNIVDLCAVLDTLNIIKRALSLRVDDKATDEIHKNVDREIAELEKYRGTNVQKIIADICRVKTFDLAWKMYERHQNLLNEFTIVKYNDGKDPSCKVIDLFKPFSHIEKSKRHLYSIFYRGQVNCISRNALMQDKSLINNERNVVFDNNVARYLKSYSAGQKIDVDISGIIKIMTTIQGITFDYSPYIVENLLSDNYDSDGLLKNVFYIERLYYGYYRNNKTDSYCLDAARKQILAFDNDYMLNLFSGLYKKVYVRMLILAYIYLKFHKRPKQQFENLCRCFSEELNDYAIPELSMAYDFYYYHNVDFLSCIQKNTKNLICKLKNMSWDIAHIRNVYESSLAVNGGDLCIQYFCTFDDNLVDILKYFELEALAVCKRTKETIPYFHINNIPVKMISKYFDGINHENTADIDAIITKYENLLEQIMAG